MDLDDGNLMDALTKAVAQGRPKQVKWSGMQVAEVTKAVMRPQPLPKPVPPMAQPETKLEITEVVVEQGAMPYAFL